MQTISFPKPFRFGVADADLQVIGEAHTLKEEQSTPTMWHHFAKTSGKCFRNDSPLEGIDRYHHWRQDIEEMKKMGITHYRTSISMSRILKENGEVNANAIAWYTTYFQALKKAGISIMATLYHWELPQYLTGQGGWKNRKTIDVFVSHTKTVVQQLGEYIDDYLLLNEPWCSSLLSYHLGIHAPGETDLKSGLLAAHHLLLAQGVAFAEAKKIDKTLKIGTTFNVQPSYAATADPNDQKAAQYADGYFNRWFFDPLFMGKYPEDMVELYGKQMPKVTQEDLKIIHIGKNLSTMGINYYRGDIVKWNDTVDVRYESVTIPDGLTNDLNWPIFIPPHYPSGLYDILTQLYYAYRPFGLPEMMITENGMAQYASWDGKSAVVEDARRIHYISAHLKQVHDAILRGIPVTGYYAWTLMDNYEWAEGYKPNSCFGMIFVDRKTMQRVWKKSAYWYQKLIASHVLEVSA
jgi:beta-glucosidase